jgi:hypothetical protein
MDSNDSNGAGAGGVRPCRNPFPLACPSDRQRRASASAYQERFYSELPGEPRARTRLVQDGRSITRPEIIVCTSTSCVGMAPASRSTTVVGMRSMSGRSAARQARLRNRGLRATATWPSSIRASFERDTIVGREEGPPRPTGEKGIGGRVQAGVTEREPRSSRRKRSRRP